MRQVGATNRTALPNFGGALGIGIGFFLGAGIGVGIGNFQPKQKFISKILLQINFFLRKMHCFCGKTTIKISLKKSTTKFWSKLSFVRNRSRNRFFLPGIGVGIGIHFWPGIGVGIGIGFFYPESESELNMRPSFRARQDEVKGGGSLKKKYFFVTLFGPSD